MSDEVIQTQKQMNRRTLLGKGAAVVGGVLAAKAMLTDTAQAQSKAAAAKAEAAPAKPTAPAVGGTVTNGTFNVTVIGEMMAQRPFAMQTEPQFLGIAKMLREADLSYAHLETNLASDDEVGAASRGAIGKAGYLIADPQIGKDIKWFGVDAISLAMNHAYDWGEKGLLASLKNTRRAGLVGAGTGHNLEEARAPVYFEKDKGRIALIAASAGNSANEWAGYAKGAAAGRAGINPIRVRSLYEVDQTTAANLKAAGKALGTLSVDKEKPQEFNFTPGAQGGATGYSGFTFVEGNKCNITTDAYQPDIIGNLRSVEEAARMADFTMFALHNSISEGKRGDTPCTFVVDFARKVIDAGADLFIGHGWHTCLGIEIYKNKPIIYGVGNFFWQSQYISRVPADSYEAYGYDMDKLETLHASVGPMHPEGGEDWAWTTVYQLKYVDGKISEIHMHPVEMGLDFSKDKPTPYRLVGKGPHKYLDGTPWLATGVAGQRILERAKALCQKRGTKVEIVDNVGIIKVNA